MSLQGGKGRLCVLVAGLAWGVHTGSAGEGWAKARLEG